MGNKKKFVKNIKEHWLTYMFLILGIMIINFPIYVTLVASTHDAATISRGKMPLYFGDKFLENYKQAWYKGTGERVKSIPIKIMLINSLILAFLTSFGKIILSILSAYSIEFFNLPIKNLWFGLIFATLFMPLEVRLISTYKLMSDLKLIDTYPGLIIPIIVSASGTLLLRQSFKSLPREVIEAAIIDGAGPTWMLLKIIIPLIKPNLASLFIILFLYGWNQYLWPLIVMTNPEHQPIVVGITKMIGGAEATTDWNIIMASTIIAMIIPLFITIFAQKWLIKGLVELEK